MMCHFPVKKIKMFIHFQGVLAWRSVQPFNFCSLTFAPLDHSGHNLSKFVNSSADLTQAR